MPWPSSVVQRSHFMSVILLYCGSLRFEFFSSGAQHDEVDSAICRAAFGVIIRGHRPILSITHSRESLRRNTGTRNQILEQKRRAPGGQFPVGWKLRRMDGNVVR